jgi:hypothetical protein
MYHEVTMIEFREVLRLWQEQVPKKRIAAQVGLDPKTVRRYLRAAEAAGWERRAGARRIAGGAAERRASPRRGHPYGLHRILGRDNRDITGARGALHNFDNVTHNVAQSAHA